MNRELILEIGTEEIPAGYLPPAIEQLKKLVVKELAGQRLSHGDVAVYATPRRLALIVQGVSERQDANVKEVLGPARGVAFGDDGKPTRAAEGFARGQGVAVGDLKIIDTPRGEYVAAVKEETSAPAMEILPQMMSRMITSLHFPKYQRWGYGNLRFPRPIRWILCLLGTEIVPFELDGIVSGRKTRGHRFLSPGPFEVPNTGEYLKIIRNANVVLDQDERRKIIEAGVIKAAAGVNGVPIDAPELLDEVTFLVEYPVVLLGSFEEKYLSLPWEVLITSMGSHQRYFAVIDGKGNLQPNFITVSNTRTDDDTVVIKGNERVLRARLEDGMFFFQEDRKVPLEQRIEELKDVVFQEKLGTSFEKMERFSEIARTLAEAVAPDRVDEVLQVAYLCKGDLVTQMVGEFADLQGVMGKEYALLEGVGEEVAQGIVDHYLPKTSGGKTPGTVGGAVVSIADRLDTVCGCFGIGITPSGTADPYGLRRHALAIIAILMDQGWRVSISDMMVRSLDLLQGKIDIPSEEVTARLHEFFKGRLQNLFTGKGHRYDLVQAVLEEQWEDPVDAAARLEALGDFAQQAGFTDLMLSFKRVMNIIPADFRGSLNRDVLSEKAEKELLEAADSVGNQVKGMLAAGDYSGVLIALAALKAPVDGFFDGVMVMDKDPEVRENRLSILAAVSTLFERIADFRKVVTE
ncbi:MAG TPA: glycine--tRNA ligase subunit beta [Proteobacteria bacterium]|nr:glycine--tRNA ligase beta subunit [bacterium BMS3Abin14]HDL53029.1 glycine--tRNA ligase subunit beta [Pseudomonadota bacterium]